MGKATVPTVLHRPMFNPASYAIKVLNTASTLGMKTVAEGLYGGRMNSDWLIWRHRCSLEAESPQMKMVWIWR